MQKWNNDDLFYVCSMIEFVARKTHNKTKDIVVKLSDKELAHQLKAAGVNHCLSFEQVCDEWIEEYGIEEGTFDNISTCKYNVPTVLSIGTVYQTLILNVIELYEDVIDNKKKYIVHLLVKKFQILIQMFTIVIRIILSVLMRQEYCWIRDVFYRSFGAALFIIAR